MLYLEHIGIAVKDLKKSNELFTKLFGTAPYKEEKVESEKVTNSFFKTGATKIELLEAQNPESAVATFIEKRGEGIHHLAFEVENIFEAVKQMEAAGFIFTKKEPHRGADNKLVCFI